VLLVARTTTTAPARELPVEVSSSAHVFALSKYELVSRRGQRTPSLLVLTVLVVLCNTNQWSPADAAFFGLLDKDGDGKVTVDDLKDCLRQRNLPGEYAQQFIERARGGRWWASSINFQEFKSLVDDNESKMLRAFSLLETDAKGNLDLNKLKGVHFELLLHFERLRLLFVSLDVMHVPRQLATLELADSTRLTFAGSLAKLGLPATESNARAMLRALGKAEDASIAYGEFRRFALLMPRDKLVSDKELNLKWFESATCVPIGSAHPPFSHSGRPKMSMPTLE
jgi:Ca2+-binding EF-hand superfamily protein